MFNELKNIFIKFYNRYRNIWNHFLFGMLLLWNLVLIPTTLREIISILSSRNGYVKPFSSVWYEQSKEAKIFFEQQNVNLLMACCIMASLLYCKHKKLAFLCVIIPSVYVITQRIITY